MRILFIDRSDTERELYRIYLENTLSEASLVEAVSLDNALNLLHENHEFDLILWRDHGENHIKNFFGELKSKFPSCILVVFGNRSPDKILGLEGFRTHNHAYIQHPISPKEFCLSILQIVAPSRSSLERVPAFQKVRLVNFYRFNKVLCPVYLQLSDRKYIKVLHAHTTYQKSDIDSYRNKGVEYFYIANSDFEKFKVTFTEQRFLERVDAGKESLDQISATQILLHDLVGKIGISQSAIEMADRNIASIKSYIEDHSGLSQLFMRQNQASNYLYDHGHLIAMVCCNIFNRLNWDTSDNIYKLCSAAIFHDLALHAPQMAMLDGCKDPKLSDFSKSDVDQYLHHPESIAKELEKIDTISSEVIEMVRYHHEDNDGTGFYRIHPSRLSKMSATFIIAHRYIHLMYQHEFNPTKNGAVIQQLKSEFPQSIFASILTSFDLPQRQKFKQTAA